MIAQANALSMDLSDEELYPCYGRCRANFNAAAAAPELRLVRKFLDTLVDDYQNAVPGSTMAKSYLFNLRSECETLIRDLFLKDITGDCTIGIFPGTSRAMEVALGAVGPPAEIILSPLEHGVESEVADWLSRSASATVTRLTFSAADHESNWGEQRAQLLEGFGQAVAVALRRGKRPVVVISQVCWASGLLIPVDEIVHPLREQFGESIKVVIDGAHGPGNLVKIELAGDYDAFVFSAHKWLLSPEPCGVLVWAGERLRSAPYDAWLIGAPAATTCGVRMIGGLRSGLEVFRRLDIGDLRKRSNELKDLFFANLPQGLKVVGSGNGLVPTQMLALRPENGWAWRFKRGTELRSHFDEQGVSVTVVELEAANLWVRLSFSYFLGEPEVERLCRALAKVLCETDVNGRAQA